MVASDDADAGHDGHDGHDGDGDDEPIPQAVRERATRLTRHARTTDDEAARGRYLTERESLLAEYGYTARVRETDATLVLHPVDWLEEGTVRPDRIQDTDAALEIPLGGPDEDWAVVDRHNRRVVDRVAEEHGEPHAANVDALADYAGNHHEKRIEHLGEREVERFVSDYVVRNAWPTEEQLAVLEESVAIARDVARGLEASDVSER
jgi:hypothetical protein